MAFGGSGLSSVFDDDPFFSGFPSFPQMGFGLSRHQALSDGAAPRDRQVAQRRDPFGSMWPFGGGDPFARMDAMMNQMMQETRNNSNSHSYSSSSVMHYSSGGEGRQPRVYHATSSTRQAPGGIKETRKTERDSESGLQKMAIGHHINDRSHTIERRVNAKTNEKEEHQELINLDESEAPQFNQEWQQRSCHANTRLRPSLRPSHQLRALPSIDTSISKHHSSHAHKHHPYDMSHHSRHHRRQPPHLEPLDTSTDRRYNTPLAGEVKGQGDHFKERKSKGKDSKKKVHYDV